MALLVLVAFTPATCDVGCASGCGPNTLSSGLVPGDALATAGATIMHNDFDMLLEPYAGMGKTLVWEGYPPPTYFLSSMCKEEGPCLAYEDFPGAFGLDSAPHYVAIGAQVVRWPAPTLDPGAESAPDSVLGSTCQVAADVSPGSRPFGLARGACIPGSCEGSCGDSACGDLGHNSNGDRGAAQYYIRSGDPERRPRVRSKFDAADRSVSCSH